MKIYDLINVKYYNFSLGNIVRAKHLPKVKNVTDRVDGPDIIYPSDRDVSTKSKKIRFAFNPIENKRHAHLSVHILRRFFLTTLRHHLKCSYNRLRIFFFSPENRSTDLRGKFTTILQELSILSRRCWKI